MKKTYFPLHVHSDNSLLDGLSKPSQIARRCKDVGLPGSAITDHGNVSCAVSFISAMNKMELKPIIGCEMYICEQDASIREKGNGALNHLVVLAKNKKGWEQLIKATSESNKPENFYRKPRLSIEQLSNFADGNLIAFSGHLGSRLSNDVFSDIKKSCDCKTENQAKKTTNEDWVYRGTKTIEKLKNAFGKDNFFIEIQLIDGKRVPAMRVLASGLRYLAKKTNTKTIGTPDAHYAKKSDAIDQRILLCSSLNLTFNEVYQKINRGENVGLSSFFASDNYHIPSYEEMIQYGNTENELENTLLIADFCDTYELSAPPMLPKFSCPGGLKSNEYMIQLLKKGWKELYPKIKRVIDTSSHTEQEYIDRLKMEMEVLMEAGLADYFLVVRDIIKWARNQEQLTGAGRGSAAGSLVLYLLGVTHIDPIEFNLLFERFYNSARNIPKHVSFEEDDFLNFIGV